MSEKKILRIINFTLWTLLGLTVAFCLLNALTSLLNPYPDDYVNGIVVNYADLLLTKGCYFLPITQYPLVHAAYPPVFIVIAAMFFKLFGSSFLIIRLLSLTFSLLICALLYLFAKKLTGNKMLAIYSAGIFLAPNFMYDWITAGRVDTLAILFSLLGLYLYFSDNKKLLWPIVLFTLAFYTKHSTIAAAAAVFLDLLWLKRDGRNSLYFASLLGSSIIAIFALGTWLSQGQFFLHLITYTKVAVIELPVALTKYVRFFRPLALLTGLAVYGLLTRKLNVLGVYFLLNVILMVTAGKDGAASNYFIEPLVSLILLSICTVDQFLKKYKKEAIMITLLLLFQVVGLLNNPRYYLDIVKKLIRPNYTAQRQLSELVQGTPGNILSEDVGYLTMNHKAVWLGEPFQFMKMAKAGIWDPAPLINDCYQRRFALILAGERLKAIPGMQACLDRAYRKTGTILDLDIYQ